MRKKLLSMFFADVSYLVHIKICFSALLSSLISLSVYSSLSAVGLTAAVSSALAEGGVAANVIAALWHDHILVPQEQVGKRIRVIFFSFPCQMFGL